MKKYFVVLLSVIFIILSSANIAFAQVGNLGTTSDLSTCPEVIVNTADSTQKQIKVNELYGDNSKNLDASNLNNGNPDEALQAYNPAKGHERIEPLYVDANNKVTFEVTKQKYTRGYLLSQVSAYYKTISCPATITGLQTLFLRMLMIINTFVGFVLFYVIARAAIIRMTARGDAEAVKKSMSMISNAIVGLVIVIIAYTAVIFIGTQFLPSDPCQKFSFIDSGKILFFFDQSDISPVTVTSKDNPNCS